MFFPPPPGYLTQGWRRRAKLKNDDSWIPRGGCSLGGAQLKKQMGTFKILLRAAQVNLPQRNLRQTFWLRPELLRQGLKETQIKGNLSFFPRAAWVRLQRNLKDNIQSAWGCTRKAWGKLR